MRRRQNLAAVWLMAVILMPMLRAQEPGTGAGSAAGIGQPQTLDSVVAVIDGDVLLESDIDEELRFSAFLPYSVTPQSNTRVHAAERLIDRTLILHQERLQPGEAVSDEDVNKRITELRKQIPACGRYHCETEQGWKKYLSDNGFTEDEVRAEWRNRLEILSFIETRFKSGIKITAPEIQAYYDKTLLPQFEKEGAKAPPEASIAPRIEEILLQERVSTLLFDWLQSLREQGSVHVLDPTIANTSSRDELNRRTNPRPLAVTPEPEKKPQ